MQGCATLPAGRTRGSRGRSPGASGACGQRRPRSWQDLLCECRGEAAMARSCERVAAIPSTRHGGFATAPTVSGWMRRGEPSAPVPAAGTTGHGSRPCPAWHTPLQQTFIRRAGRQRAASPSLAIGNNQSFEEEEGKTQQIPAVMGAAAYLLPVLPVIPSQYPQYPHPSDLSIPSNPIPVTPRSSQHPHLHTCWAGVQSSCCPLPW